MPQVSEALLSAVEAAGDTGGFDTRKIPKPARISFSRLYSGSAIFNLHVGGLR